MSATRNDHLNAGLIFIIVCILLGAGLFVLTRASSEDDLVETDQGLINSEIDESSIEPAEREETIESSTPTESRDGPVAAWELDDSATLSPASVWSNSDSGTMSCEVDGRPANVQWHRESNENAVVVINDKTVQGELAGDWQPSNSTMRYDFEGSVPEINAKLTISDEGDLAITNDQTQEMIRGQCRKA